MKVVVRVGFHNLVREDSTLQRLEVDVEPSDTVLQLKQKIATAAGGTVAAADLLLCFGPNDRKIGRQYVNDPTLDENKVKVQQYSILGWIQRFPHWALTGAFWAWLCCAVVHLVQAPVKATCLHQAAWPHVRTLQLGCCRQPRHRQALPYSVQPPRRSSATQTRRWLTRAPRHAPQRSTRLRSWHDTGQLVTMTEIISPAWHPARCQCGFGHPAAGRDPEDQRPAGALGQPAITHHP
jgi:hypothetical protein